MKVALVLLAAGLSSRFKDNKMFFEIDSKPLIIKSLESYMLFDDRISDIIVVCKDIDKPKIVKYISEYFPSNKKRIFYTAGGVSRSVSTFNALKFIVENKIDSEYIAITDGARCWTSTELINRLISSLGEYDNAIPAIRRAETFKIIENGKIKRTLKNNYLYEIQTPQVFNSQKIIEAYRNGFYRKKWSVDDSAIYFSYFVNENINIVLGDVNNIKVTFKEDIKQ